MTKLLQHLTNQHSNAKAKMEELEEPFRFQQDLLGQAAADLEKAESNEGYSACRLNFLVSSNKLNPGYPAPLPGDLYKELLLLIQGMTAQELAEKVKVLGTKTKILPSDTTPPPTPTIPPDDYDLEVRAQIERLLGIRPCKHIGSRPELPQRRTDKQINNRLLIIAAGILAEPEYPLGGPDVSFLKTLDLQSVDLESLTRLADEEEVFRRVEIKDIDWDLPPLDLTPLDLPNEN